MKIGSNKCQKKIYIHPTLVITNCVSNLTMECDLTFDIYFLKDLSNILERTNLDQTLSQKFEIS
jgi:hypothetical protein